MGKLAIAILQLVLLVAQAGPAVSGKLAYVRNGDVWVKTLPDGAARQVSQGGGAESPQWSSSGQWMAFRQGRKEILVSTAGRRLELTPDEIAWSPRRDELAFADRDGLWLIDLDESNPAKHLVFPRTITEQVGGFSWSPDGSAFALSVVTPDPAGLPDFRVGHLWRINSDGTQQKELFTPKQRGGVDPVGWASEGQRIIFRVDPDFSSSVAADGLPLFSIAANSGAAQPLATQVLVHPGFMSISPMKREILAASGGGRETWTNKRLILSDPFTGRATELTDGKSIAVFPAWSLDGSQIAYVRSPDNKESQRTVVGTVASPRGQRSVQPVQGGGDEPKTTLNQRRIWMIGIDGKPRQLTSDSGYRDEYPLWSADGRSVVFTRIDQQDKASIWTMAIDNGIPEKIVDDIAMPSTGWFGFYGYIDWSKYVALYR